MDDDLSPVTSPTTGLTWHWKVCPDCGARFYGPRVELPEHECDVVDDLGGAES